MIFDVSRTDAETCVPADLRDRLAGAGMVTLVSSLAG